MAEIEMKCKNCIWGQIVEQWEVKGLDLTKEGPQTIKNFKVTSKHMNYPTLRYASGGVSL